MAPAQTARAAPGRRTSKAPPRRRSTASPVTRVRWDRVGRVSLLIVLAVVLGLYVNQGLTYFSVRSQADQQRATALTLARENRRLAAEQQLLREPATIERDARQLGMVLRGERAYVIVGHSGR
jgi:cell division protein FtsB